MTHPTQICLIADRRIEEAENLCANAYPDGAFYLGGYAVELYLKAKICEHFDLPDFYHEYAPKSDLSKTFLVHNLERLMLLSGLSTKFVVAKRADALLDVAWSNLKEWSEKNRYDIIGLRTVADAEKFLNSVKIVIQWIKIN